MASRLITILTSAALVAGYAAGASLYARTSAAQSVSPHDTISRDLALATFDSAWLKIQVLHYDSLMNGIDWAEARTALRPKAESARTTVELREVLGALLARLGESHFSLIPREVSAAFTSDSAGSVDGGTPGDLGIDMRLLGREVLVTHVDSGAPAYLSGVRAGWQVMGVGDVSAAASLKSIDSLQSARAIHEARTRIVLRMYAAARGAAGASVNITVTDPRGAEHRLQLTRRQTPGEVVKYGNLPTIVARVSATMLKDPGATRCTGIIRFNTWMPVVAGRIDAAVDSLRSCSGVVIDLRGNTGGVANMVIGIAGHFLANRDTLGTLKMRSAQLRLVANPRMSNAKGESVKPFSGRVAILVDGLTSSTSEIFAGALQSLGRARVFGDTTTGQALPATLYRLPNKDVLMLAVADFRGPHGERIEGKGIMPDVVHESNRAELLEGRDAVLEAALQWISSETQLPSGGRHN